MRGQPPRRETKKPRTAVRHRRRLCAKCRKRSLRPVESVPYICPRCARAAEEAEEPGTT